ncbi:MAG TPA: hypothetical protein VLH39_04380 [Magnetospirillaceae bacterium]|nr:hypothetical protein [Magnetospirillaceae bacterium]
MKGAWAVASSAAGLAAVLAGRWAGVSFDPLFLGIVAGAAVAAAGLIAGWR